MLKSSYSKIVGSFGIVLAIGLSLSPFIGMARAEDQAQPADDKPSFTFTTDFLSQYIFRGVALSRDSMVIEPSFTAVWKGFLVNVWGNADTHEAPNLSGSKDAASWTETDLTLSYTHTIYGKLSGTVGYVYYGTNYAPDTMEGTFGQ